MPRLRIGELERNEARLNGNKVYYGGRACSRNHSSFGRYVSNNNCVECEIIRIEKESLLSAIKMSERDLPFVDFPKTRSPSVWRRFFNFVPKNLDKNECWNWQGCTYRGYGELGGGDKSVLRAHRLAYESIYGEIPDNLHVLHKCDNPSCVNPNHLFLGTQLDNNKDAKEKGRSRNHPTYGSNNPRSKLTEEDVRFIREYIDIPGIKLSKKFGVDDTTISSIRNGKSWVWLK